MNRILLPLLLALALAAGAGAPAPAQAPDSPLASAIAWLEADGYTVVDARLSWFGRLVVTATRAGALREVVLNRTTGAVLSDRLFAQASTGDAGSGGAGAAMSGSGGGAASGSTAGKSGGGSQGSGQNGRN